MLYKLIFNILWMKICTIREIGIPKKSRSLYFTIYLSDLLVRVGFVTGVTFTTHLGIVNFIDSLTFLKHPPLSLGCYFCWERALFWTCHVSLFSAGPLYQMCVSTIGSFSLFCEIVENIVKHKSNLGLGGFLWFVIYVYFNYLSNMTF